MGPALLAAALVAFNNVANRWRPFHGWAYVPLNIIATAGVLLVGRCAFDLDRAAMGLTWSRWWIGASMAAVAGVALAVMLSAERTRRIVADERLAGVTGRRAAFMIGVRIPVGTAALEEIAFRGVLLGALLGEGTAVAVAASSIAFGLWHVTPTLVMARLNRRRPLPTVVAGVLLTTAVGVLLGVLRVETGGIGAPFALHAGANMLGAAAAILAHKLEGAA